MVGLMLFASCEKKKQTTGINVEDTIATDTLFMTSNYDNYRWFEVVVTLQNFLDEDSLGNKVVEVSNVFQTTSVEDTSFDTHVVICKHNEQGSSYDVRHGFWVEDLPLVKDDIKLTFEEAYEKVMATNCPKPHSKYVVLRKELGPKNCNPQYIFGNVRAQLYVDAVTGEVADKNPVFEGFNLATPVWP